MSAPLNDIQLEILKLFQQAQSEEDLKEIKSLLITYLADKVTRTADKAFDQKGHTASVFEKWKKEHFRKRA
jgi:5-deoxy-D-glucuronate isomerase